ncbi:nucleophile aminohydrolase [Mycena sanguinolenta]|nr:nucleophile aminohydrolase [Mycena sanguinolenta]
MEAMLDFSLKAVKHRGPDAQRTFVSQDRRDLGTVDFPSSISKLEINHSQMKMTRSTAWSREKFTTTRVFVRSSKHKVVSSKRSRTRRLYFSCSEPHFFLPNTTLIIAADTNATVSSLRGEFAFVLYDANRRLLFAARDRFGAKPMSYTIHNGRLLIASEIKSFLPLGWRAEWDIDSVVNNGYFADDRTVFKGVRKLMAGH